MFLRLAKLARPFAAGAACAAVVLAAGCSSGGSSGSSGAASANPAHSGGQSASQALSLAASAARSVTSFTATMDITSSGAYTSHMAGTVQEQTKPTVMVHEKFSISANGTAVPGGMEAVVTSKAMYLKMAALTKALGKPWVGITFSSLKQNSGLDLAPLLRQFQSNNPLAMAQMLPASTNVRRVGSAVLDGTPTTEYSGTYHIAAGLAKLDPSLRKVLEPALSATGVTTAQFQVWIDGQNHLRKLVEVEKGSHYQVHSTVVITSINQPANIAIPPPSQVASLPGL